MQLAMKGGTIAQRKQVTRIFKAVLALGYIETDNLFLDVKFSALETKEGDLGRVCCAMLPDYNYFLFGFDCKQSPAQLADSVAHELIHVYQFLQGDLTYTNNDQDFVWKGEPQENVPYYEQPAEIMAHGFSQILLLTAEQNHCT